MPPDPNVPNNTIPRPLDQERFNNPDTQSEVQPDAEPGAPGSQMSDEGSQSTPTQQQGSPTIPGNVLNPEQDMAREHMAQNTPVPVETGEEDDLVCEGLHCMDVEPESIQLDQDQAWHCTFYVHEHDIEA